jgi:hypothetical protein
VDPLPDAEGEVTVIRRAEDGGEAAPANGSVSAEEIAGSNGQVADTDALPDDAAPAQPRES